MKSVDQIARGAADFYDAEIRPSLPGAKGIIYGIAVGRAAANAPQLIDRYSAILLPLGIIKDGMIDAEGLATDLKKQMGKNGGVLNVRVFGDEFTFVPGDVDNLLKCIERA